MTERNDSSSARKQTEESQKHPHGMPLTLSGGGYFADECTGPKAELAGHLPEATADDDDAAPANER